MFGKKKRHEEENLDVVYVKNDYSDWPYLDAIQGYKEETDRLIAAATAILKLSKGELKHGYYPKGILLSGDPGVGKTTAAKGMIHIRYHIVGFFYHPPIPVGNCKL
jgi:SpoVK/Ycf46/Vps4 family AAA+-type ATPase